MRAERMFKEYHNMKRELSVLEFQLNHCDGVSADGVIATMCFSYSENERVQSSGVSDITAKTALNYRKTTKELNEEWFNYLIGQYVEIKEELDFFEHSIKNLQGDLSGIIWKMVIIKIPWKELAREYHVSEAMIGKYRKKAVKELDAIYKLRDRQTESYILG